ncbi:hypothetical protein FRX31_029832, partial [Thalictrum thalictroides]
LVSPATYGLTSEKTTTNAKLTSKEVEALNSIRSMLVPNRRIVDYDENSCGNNREKVECTFESNTTCHVIYLYGH